MEELLESLDQISSLMSNFLDALFIAAYILESLALFSIAKRRGISKPGLAWVPLLQFWILGSLSDQYRYVTRREVANRRKILLGLSIALVAMAVIYSLIMIAVLFDFIIPYADQIAGMIERADFERLLRLIVQRFDNYIGLALLVILAIPLMVLSVILTIHYWIAMHDVFRSCNPATSTLFLILSILGGMFIEGAHAIFLMINRNKELGMPPRKPQPVPQPVIVEAQPVWQPQPEPIPAEPVSLIEQQSIPEEEQN